jgi:hypothetical protein
MPERYPTRDQTGYSRLETDEEFRKRVGSSTYRKGDDLDDYIWNVFRKQRKFIRE